MNKVLNVTERTNILIHAIAFIAANSQMEMVPVSLIAKELKVSLSYLAKVLQPIVKTEILESLRGAKGGYKLIKNPDKIKLIDLLTLSEGAFPKDACLFDSVKCTAKSCPFRNLSNKIKSLMIEELSASTVSDLAKNFKV